MEIKLLKPLHNSVISLLTDVHIDFIKNNGNKKSNVVFDYLNLVKQNEDRTFPAPVVLKWKTDMPSTAEHEMYVVIGEDDNFTQYKEYRVFGNELSVFNLFIGKKYVWKICVRENGRNIFCSDSLSFITASSVPRWIKADGLSNVRDIGGWSLNDGKRVKQGMVYRGCEMEFHHTITEDGKKVLLDDLKIRTDLDLRIEAVGEINKSALGDRVNLKLIPSKAYGDFLTEKEVCRKIFKLFCNEENYPFYIHCWGGADRTGTVIFLLCAILGMNSRDLYMDYELTSLSIWGERSSESDLFMSLINTLNKYGDVSESINIKCERYILSTGITIEEIEQVRNIMTEII